MPCVAESKTSQPKCPFDKRCNCPPLCSRLRIVYLPDFFSFWFWFSFRCSRECFRRRDACTSSRWDRPISADWDWRSDRRGGSGPCWLGRTAETGPRSPSSRKSSRRNWANTWPFLSSRTCWSPRCETRSEIGIALSACKAACRRQLTESSKERIHWHWLFGWSWSSFPSNNFSLNTHWRAEVDFHLCRSICVCRLVKIWDFLLLLCESPWWQHTFRGRV